MKTISSSISESADAYPLSLGPSQGRISPSAASSLEEGRVSYQEFATLAASFMAELYNAARRLTGEAQEAEDLVQETYARACRTWRQLKDSAHCRAWLYQIMRRLWIDTYRRRQARPEAVMVEGEEAEATPVSAWGASPEEEVLRRLSAAEIHHALALLPEELRTAVLLCDVEGFTYAEIAEIMECPIGTVGSRVTRARQKLLSTLREQTEAHGSEQKDKK